MTVNMVGIRSRAMIWGTEACDAARAHAGLSLLVLVYVLIAFAVAGAFSNASHISVWLYGSLFKTSIGAMGLLFLAARAVYIMVIVHPERLTKAIMEDIFSNSLARRRLFDAIPIFCLLSVFNSTFTSLKVMIPTIHPYDWDTTLMTWDRALHFGVAPWALIQPVFGYPVITSMLNVMYNLWFFVLIGCVIWQAFADRDQRLRTQFFATYILCFAVLGNFAATWLASGGPCYYGLLVAGPDPYGPLMSYLHHASQQAPFVWVVATQDMLWKTYMTDSLNVGGGITAMPSMHLAGVTLFALLGWRTSTRLGIALTAYAMVIMIGSVHLGWHYAIDGYFGILGTLAIWWVVGAVLNRSKSLLPPTVAQARRD
jgi:hypothetical protein